MASTKYVARMRPGGRTDASVVGDITITRKWTEVPATVAKDLESQEWNGKPMYEVVEAKDADNAPAETSTSNAEGAE